MSRILISFFILISLLYSPLGFSRKPPPIYSAQHLVFSKNKSQLIYLSKRTDIIKINTANGKILTTARMANFQQLETFAATPDGFKILAKASNGIAVIHNGTGKVLRTLPYPDPKNRFSGTYIQSHDGVLLAISSTNKITIIHTGSGKKQYTINLVKEGKDKNPVIRSMGFGPKRRYFAYITQSQGVYKSVLTIYDTYRKTNLKQIELTGSFYGRGKIHFSKNGLYLISEFDNRKGFSLVNIKTETVKTIKTSLFSFIGFSSDDSKVIMVLPSKNLINLYPIKTGKIIKTNINLHQNGGYFGYDVAQSADKSLLALPFASRFADKENQFLIINTNTGKLLRHLSAL